MLEKIQFKMRERLPKSQKSNRLFKAGICFLIAIASTVTIYAEQQDQNMLISIVKVKHILSAGTQIKSTDLEAVEVGEYGLPADVITSEDKVAGKYAKTDLYPSDSITPDKISDAREDPFSGISSNKKIMSFTVSSLAASVANNIKVGDIIQVIYGQTTVDASGLNGDTATIAPECLQRLKVIDIKDANGYVQETDKKGGGTSIYSASSFIPSVITVEVDDVQAAELYKAELSESIYVLFVER